MSPKKFHEDKIKFLADSTKFFPDDLSSLQNIPVIRLVFLLAKQSCENAINLIFSAKTAVGICPRENEMSDLSLLFSPDIANFFLTW